MELAGSISAQSSSPTGSASSRTLIPARCSADSSTRTDVALSIGFERSSRVVVADYSYVRYFFTNHSADIRRIFIEHCELLGIRVTQSNPRNLTVSHRDSVAVLEQIVGPKT
jgi:hypothetical protein